MDKRLISLQEYGCNTESALTRLLGDVDLYMECLLDLQDEKNFPKLEEALKNHNITAAFEAAHALKGVFANLEVTPMFKKVIEIVEPLRNKIDDNLEIKYVELVNMRDELVGILLNTK